MTPTELVSAILKAPVDLLYNGGIGTYVKAASETHAEVGDRANDALRINGAELRVKVVGEGGNLGFTQRGRIEAALAGVRIYTDAIDSSAGMDTSDHEVNIKILLGLVESDGKLTQDQRNALLPTMTDEVAMLMLRDNYFPKQLALNIAGYVDKHPLKREIIATHVLNSMVNRVGPAFVFQLAEQTGATPAQVVRGYLLTRESFGSVQLWQEIEALDNRLPDEA